jgi:hypothetical protein
MVACSANRSIVIWKLALARRARQKTAGTIAYFPAQRTIIPRPPDRYPPNVHRSFCHEKTDFKRAGMDLHWGLPGSQHGSARS